MPQMLQVLRERAIGMLTAGMSTRVVARELNVNFSTVSRLYHKPVCITKEFLHKLSETVSGKLICMLVVLVGVSTWLQFVVITDLSVQMLTFDGVWHFGEVFSSRMNPGFHCTGQMADSVYGFVWVNGLLKSTLWIEWPIMVAGGVMVWAGVCYGQRTQVNFIDGILNAQRYHDEILRPIVVPFIHDHHLMLQHDNARLARICTQFLEA